MTKILPIIGATSGVLLLALMLFMTMGIDCTGNPNMNPFDAISMAQQGLCR